MKCPKCGFVSYNYLDTCKRCGHDLAAVRRKLGIEPDPKSVLLTSGAAPERVPGGEGAAREPIEPRRAFRRRLTEDRRAGEEPVLLDTRDAERREFDGRRLDDLVSLEELERRQAELAAELERVERAKAESERREQELRRREAELAEKEAWAPGRGGRGAALPESRAYTEISTPAAEPDPNREHALSIRRNIEQQADERRREAQIRSANAHRDAILAIAGEVAEEGFGDEGAPRRARSAEDFVIETEEKELDDDVVRKQLEGLAIDWDSAPVADVDAAAPFAAPDELPRLDAENLGYRGIPQAHEYLELLAARARGTEAPPIEPLAEAVAETAEPAAEIEADILLAPESVPELAPEPDAGLLVEEIAPEALLDAPPAAASDDADESAEEVPPPIRAVVDLAPAEEPEAPFVFSGPVAAVVPHPVSDEADADIDAIFEEEIVEPETVEEEIERTHVRRRPRHRPSVRKGGLGVRTLAGLIDVSALAVVLGVFLLAGRGVLLLMGDTANVADYMRLSGPFYILFLMIGAAYFTFFVGSTGQTPGMMVFGLKVVNKSGGAIGYGLAFLRHVASLFSALCFGMGFISIPLDHNKQGWHDKITQSVVVRV
ncbi:RDD family protein [bacterium]|nr:RDD family protein [bacterium]